MAGDIAGKIMVVCFSAMSLAKLVCTFIQLLSEDVAGLFLALFLRIVTRRIHLHFHSTFERGRCGIVSSIVSPQCHSPNSFALSFNF